ncbi:MAG: cation diffusion facilitator family transporter [Acidiferrobacterales bacterium]|jgi:cation diffusion facilitator family transporter|nr:cation diffusion facilitator family transporter [Acidiferrobacterales bacterium]
MAEENPERLRETVKVTLIGSAVDLTLGVLKIVFGYTAQSQALIVDGFHSLSDLATDFMVIFAAKHSHREADEEHPYGHGRIETLATVGLSIALIAVGIGFSVDAIQRLFHPELLLTPHIAAIYIAVLSIVSKEVIYHYSMVIARKYRSEMLKANAWHSRTDAISSAIVVIGVAGAMAGLNYLDAIAAIGVAVMIAKIGWDLGWQSLRELIDTGLEAERVELIKRTIMGTNGVEALHLLRSRRLGGEAYIDVHIQVPPRLSVSEGHQISESVRHKLINTIDEVKDVTVHIDPEDDEIAAPCKNLPSRQELQKQLDERLKNIPEARQIRSMTIHYLGGKVELFITLPASVLSGVEEIERIRGAISGELEPIECIRRVEVAFS